MRFKFVFSAEWPSLPQCLALCLNIIIHSFIPSAADINVFDDGSLLHKIEWKKGETYGSIAMKYVNCGMLKILLTL